MTSKKARLSRERAVFSINPGENVETAPAFWIFYCTYKSNQLPFSEFMIKAFHWYGMQFNRGLWFNETIAIIP